MLQDTTLDLLKFHPFPNLAGALRARQETILKRWQAVVRKKLPTADKLAWEQLQDDLPLILGEVADVLDSSDGTSVQELKESSREHASTRYHQSYSLNEVMVEYGLLRPIIMDETMSHLGRDITIEEVVALNMGIDMAERRSVRHFVEYQRQQIHTVGEAQTKYLSFLSHDLRGGLNGVLLTAELLKRQLSADPRFAESVADIDSMRRAILETVATMDRFLHAERFRQGKVEASASAVDLGLLISGFTGHFSHQLREKNLQLRVVVPGALTVVSDRDLLFLILQNLISNAIKYTPAGEITVSADFGEDSTCTLSVSDQGPGIPADRIATLFDAFTRGDTHGQPGVGLGLYIVKQAADLLGAQLSVQSSPARGATFQIKLPPKAD